MDLIKSENALVSRLLYTEDGTTPIPLSSLTYLVAEVRQYNRLFATYSYVGTPSDPEIRQGDETNEVIVEITEELSLKLKEGPLYVRIKGKQVDSDYTVDGEVYDIDEQECFNVII